MKIFDSLKKVYLISVLLIIPPLAITAEPQLQKDADDEDVTSSTDSKKKPGYHTSGFRIRPSVSVTETYDDNIFATDNNTESDFITVVSPRIHVDSTWDKHSLRFKFGADIGRYTEYDAENYDDYWLSVDGKYNPDQATYLFGGLGFAADHEGRDSPDAVTGGLQPTTYETRSASAGINTIQGDTTYRIGATYENLDYDNVLTSGGNTIINDDRDRDIIGLGIRATHKLSETDKVFVQALYETRDYDQRIDQDGYQRDSDGYRVSGGFKKDFGKGNKAEAYIGHISQDYDDNRFSSISEMDFGGSFTLIPMDKTLLTGELKRTLNETTQTGSSGYLYTSLSTQLEYGLAQGVIPHLKLKYAELDYQDHGREDDITSAEVGLKYYLTRHAYLTAGYRYMDYDSNDFGLTTYSNDFVDNSVFVTLTAYGYPLYEPRISDFDTHGEIEIGALYVDDGSPRFGRYNGLDSDGTYINGNFLVKSKNSDNSWAKLEGRNLGLDSRSLDIEWGDQGSYSAYLNYDELPASQFTGNTIFDGVGSTYLTLPTGFGRGNETTDMTGLYSNMKEVQIGTKRKKLGVGTSLLMDKNWSYSFGFQTETKEGYKQLAGGIGHAPGDIRSAMLAEPIDYTTNVIKASMAYNEKQTQVSLAYQGSFFMNHQKALHWESPFTSTGIRGDIGSISLAPDNEFHQITLSGGHSLSETTRFTGVLSYAAMYQDDTFLPDSVNTNLVPHTLPRNSLDGEVYQTNALLALSSRPMAGFNIKASYRYQERDNQTPSDTYSYHVNDAGGPGAGSTPASDTNDPYSYERNTYDLSAGYRINSNARLNGNITHETFECSPCEVRKTTEDEANLRLRLTPGNNVQLTLRGGVASKDGSTYYTVSGENLLLRKYNLADRDRQLIGADISYQPVESLTLGANVEYSENDYDSTDIGLTSSEQTSITLDASYQFSKTLSGHAYIGREIIESEQKGSQDNTSDTADWFVDNEDTVDSFGIGIKWQQSSKLNIGADYTYSGSTGDTDFTSYSALPPVNQFPDLEMDLHRFELYTDYKLQKNTSVKLSYLYEKYDADDWSIDGVNADTLAEVLLLDEDNPSYEEHVIGISLTRKF